ncbi:MAG TPA: amidohydrolase family protein [Acidimicrobiales bacterium]|nr:amidohydrolase family protein [Acidimicrobiales bacterium]
MTTSTTIGDTTIAETEITTVFDADNHYWESSDAFTRHRDPRFADRGVVLREVDGKPRYFFGERIHPIVPGPGDVHRRPRPGALYEYFQGKMDKERVGDELSCEDPTDHPDWFDHDARLAVMDQQGLEAAWLFPSQGVCMEGPMQPDVEASIEVLRAFNRWLDDDWGFAYQNRIFAVPFLTLSDLDRAVAELEWCAHRGARIITIRNGPVFTPEGTRSPADPVFDPFWARAEEAGLVVTAHAGFEDGYVDVTDAVAATWGMHSGATEGDAASKAAQLTVQLMKHRLIQDFATVLVAHKLFERFPRLRFAYIENGADWVRPLLHTLQMLHGQNPGMFKTNPVDQFIEHCWVAPFVEDDVEDVARYLPVERILFGSDWPHAEGLPDPRDYFAKVAGFSLHDQRRIMVENARELTFST